MQLHFGTCSSFLVSDETVKWVGVKFGEGLGRDFLLPPKLCKVYFGKFWYQILYFTRKGFFSSFRKIFFEFVENNDEI